MNLNRNYGNARSAIRDGDLLLFRRRWWVPHSYLIAQAGRSLYSHAAVAAHWGTSLFCLEMLQFRGGRAVLLSNRVAECPGRIDVYGPNYLAINADLGDDAVDRVPAEVVETMKRLTGTRYGWASLLKTGLRHMPVVRWFLPPPTNDNKPSLTGGDGTGTEATTGSESAPSCGSMNTHSLVASPPYCSEAISRAYRLAGCDPTPNLADRATEPGDLARSTLFTYRFTLEP